MPDNKAGKVSGSVWKMALKQFSDATTKSTPEITGGCVVTTIAGLAMTLLIMPFEISAKKQRDPSQKALLKEKIGVLKKIKKRLIMAADHDLEVFNQYRALKTGARKQDADKLKYKALLYATKSPFEVAALIKQCYSVATDCVPFCHESVISDVAAAALLLHSSFNAILALAQSNMKGLKEGDRKVYEELRLSLEEEGTSGFNSLDKAIKFSLSQ